MMSHLRVHIFALSAFGALPATAGERVLTLGADAGSEALVAEVDSIVAATPGFVVEARADVVALLNDTRLTCERDDVACLQKLAIAGAVDIVLVIGTGGDGVEILMVGRGQAEKRAGRVDQLEEVVRRALLVESLPVTEPLAPPVEPPLEGSAPSVEPPAPPAPVSPLATPAELRTPAGTARVQPEPTTELWIPGVAGGVGVVALAGALALEGVILFHPDGYSYREHFGVVSTTEAVLFGISAAAGGVALVALLTSGDGETPDAAPSAGAR